ncbi:MAG: hypothetical protein LBU60_00415 [Clostridiales bacterium]|jgi:hypothetical protein|nr:hypothetical protein [Clostridiales bacterium]
MEIVKRGDYARITYCDNCGSQLKYTRDDIYSDVINDHYDNVNIRYNIRFVLCPECRKRIILDKDFTV